jgi:hypothetical protein
LAKPLTAPQVLQLKQKVSVQEALSLMCLLAMLVVALG